ncbi:hypothetical protein [Dethiobacter alkaliphilus]|uniref:hypothetical protein n=1 Tax=Dethiobacter alkaliphilus TaxID=427926 RepID=UPI002227AC39|nr:hypothetical protein [Dethiobacter alkaliphilus]MCW3490023.1 hypothetical protein [Dethiobacter alkaliphilus]
MKKILIPLAVIAIVVVAGLALSMVNRGVEPPDDWEERVVVVDEEVSQTVTSAHNTLNNLVGWGRIERFKDPQARDWNQIGVIKVSRSGIDNESMLKDIEVFESTLAYAIDNRDWRALVDAHRIIHDLDLWVLRGDSEPREDYWGATVTLEGKDNPVYQQYIERR